MMRLFLQREVVTEQATAGRLFVDGQYECCILEDPVREKLGRPVAEWKVKGKTAIPAGTYEIIIRQSPHFKRKLPLLLNVPGYSGILIHPGNTPQDTAGCLLPGQKRDGPNVVLQSRLAFNKLFDKIRHARKRKERVWITVKNPSHMLRPAHRQTVA